MWEKIPHCLPHLPLTTQASKVATMLQQHEVELKQRISMEGCLTPTLIEYERSIFEQTAVFLQAVVEMASAPTSSSYISVVQQVWVENNHPHRAVYSDTLRRIQDADAVAFRSFLDNARKLTGSPSKSDFIPNLNPNFILTIFPPATKITICHAR